MRVLEGSLGRCEGRLARALEGLDCDRNDDDVNDDDVDDDDDDDDDDPAALVGPVVGAAGAMVDGGWDTWAGRAAAAAGGGKDK